MEIGHIRPQEWPWLLNRTAATAWDQIAPLLQGVTSQQAVAQTAEMMLSQALQPHGSAVLVTREAGAPIGYLVVTIVPDELTHIATGLFHDIWVEPPWRGRGVSSQLTGAAEQHLRAHDVRLVRRWIAAHNAASLGHAQRDGCTIERFSLVKPL